MNNLEKAKEEIIAFHEQIAGWFRGEERIGLAGIDGLLKHFSEDFQMVSPNGSKKRLADLKAWLPPTFGAIPDMRIAVSDIQGYATDQHVLLTYTEKQVVKGQEDTRYSSVVFIREKEQLLWLNLWEVL